MPLAKLCICLAVIAMAGCSEKSKQTPEPCYVSAAALLNIANMHATQTNIDAAVKFYAEVGKRFPTQDFQVLMAWKSAGDLLSDVGRHAEAKMFYEKILARFDKPNALPIVQLVVRGCKARLKGELLLSRNRE